MKDKLEITVYDDDCDGEGEAILFVNTNEQWQGPGYPYQSATLIEAAPALLKALEDIVKGEPPCIEGDCGEYCCVRVAREAIKQAKGE